MSTEWRALAAVLIDQLHRNRELTDPEWTTAFTAVPRHVFVPNATLDQAYADEAIVTQTRPAPVIGGDTVDWPSSSASAPGAVAVMLDRVKVSPGDRVLEIGTGTGYNAALLCHRLGDASVFSIDLDPDLVATAADRLDHLGYHPTLTAGDGYQGLPAGAPYDAILATCSITHVPPAWIRQLAPGGRIVAPLAGGHDAALMVLTKSADDEMTGRFDPTMTAFMPLRADLASAFAPGRVLGAGALAMAHYGTTTLDPRPLIEPTPDFTLFCHLHIAGLSIGTTDHPTHGHCVRVSDADAIADVPTARIDPGTWTTLQRGPRRLWDTIEHAAARWHTLDKPDRSRYGITATDDPARQYVWLDDPDGPYSWPFPL